MQASDGPSEPEQFERELRAILYRFDCPDAQMLGEYQLELLDPGNRTRIAAHAVQCDECRGELQTLRTFLAMPTSVPEPTLLRARRLIATLFVPRPDLAYGGLRGASDDSTRLYEAGDVTVTLGPGQTPGSLFGLVVASGHSPEALESREVRLLTREAAVLSTSLDDLGNFEFARVASGKYVLEIDLPDGVVVIEELQINS